MRGSPCALMVRHNAENLIGHPASLAEAGEFEQAIMVQFEAEYMVDGTRKVAIEDD